MPKTDFSFKIGGEAGYGIMSSGLIFAKTCLRSGYFVCDQTEYPSLIRGGHNTYTIRASEEEIFSVLKPIDLLVALNENTITYHKEELSKNSQVILNADKIDIKKISPLRKSKVYPVPLISLAQKIEAPEIMMNNVALGASIAVLQGDFETLAKVIEDIFGGAGKKEAVDLNVKAARAGFDFVKENFKELKVDFNLKKRKEIGKLLLSGNEALSLGATKAGLGFFACYPMTPVNSILSYFAQKGPDLNVVYVQPEDEISGINMAIGAAFAGTRAMVATSGGGFSLMVEGYGLAGMTETPLVIVEGQRPGPSTGLPTWGGQGDLRFVLHASQDDFPRVVLAPGDTKECFFLTTSAFNLAEKYQTPVVILTDRHLAEGHWWTDPFEEGKVKIDRGALLTAKEQQKEYKRYEITNSGISPRAIPGRKGFTFVANSDEHSEEGFSEESVEVRQAMVEKRMRKLTACQREIPNPNVYGQGSQITLVGWGSSKGPILEAQKILLKEKIKTQFLHLNYLNPLPEKFLTKFFSKVKEENALMIEQNSTAQCSGLIREKIGFNIKHHFLKYDGRPFFPEEIAEKVKQIL